MKRRNGYSDDEIVRKREALENVLVPYRADENIALLRGAGFSQTEEFFRWYMVRCTISLDGCRRT